MRTQQEMAAMYEELAEAFPFGAMTAGDIIAYMDYEHAKPFLKEDVDEASFAEISHDYTQASVIAEMRDYLTFAYEKAEGERGLSAVRSIQHYINWLWLLDDEDAEDLRAELKESFTNYGLPLLDKIKQFLKDWE